jgi:hypothetical protein
VRQSRIFHLFFFSLVIYFGIGELKIKETGLWIIGAGAYSGFNADIPYGVYTGAAVSGIILVEIDQAHR